MNGPLAGIRIIEVGHMLLGPYCGMLLADLGAEIIKVESAEGDIARSIGPHRVGPHNVYFASLNRSKKSVVLNLATEEGREALGELATTARGLIANLRPSAIRKLGLTYEEMKKWNPHIVCVAMTGYGLNSPYSDYPAYDYVIQAQTGIMGLTGDPTDPPTRAGYSIADNSTAIMGAVGLLAKVIQGTGGQVDVAMYDAMLSQLNYLAGAWLNAGDVATRLPNSAHPYIVPAQNFRTQDGWLTLFISHDGFWRVFCAEVDMPEWLTDPRFATMASRLANRDRVVSAIADLLVEATTRSWVERLAPPGLVVAAVESLEDALRSDQTRARHMIVELATPGGPIRVVGNPIKNWGAGEEFARPPLLGEHNYLTARGKGQ
ncbi:MAG: CoA transferase [Gammaproteobacteria bacterium]|nr:MAG: CoA transferase [Gammaproteobacteria bacterium]